jgi:endonuclease-8
MPERDTLARTADGLRPHLVGRQVTAARARNGVQAGRLVGATIESVEAMGKNLLIRTSNGLEVRTHLRMTGTWHRYRPGERWRRPASRVVLIIEVPGAVAVCFDAPVVEIFEARAEAVHPALANLGPDLLDDDFDPVEALRRLRAPERREMAVGDALLDQRALAGIGNVYRCEVLFIERVDPFAVVGSVDDATLGRLVATARRLLRMNADRRHGPERTTTGRDPRAGGSALWVYERAGRPCHRCGTTLRSATTGRDLPRTVWWCPSCQASAAPSVTAPDAVVVAR